MTNTPTPSASDSNCTCPSGDGSLRWPCPAHPPTTPSPAEVAKAAIQHAAHQPAQEQIITNEQWTRLDRVEAEANRLLAQVQPAQERAEPVAWVSAAELRDIQSGLGGVPVRGNQWRTDQTIPLYAGAAPSQAAQHEAPRTELSKRIRAAATADVNETQARLLIGASEEIERWEADRAAQHEAGDDRSTQIANVILRLIGECVMDWRAGPTGDPEEDAFHSDDEELRVLVDLVNKVRAASPVVRAQSEESALDAFKRWHREVGDQDCEYTWLQAWTAAQCKSAQDAARYLWLKERFTGFDFYWGGDCMAEREEDKGKCVIVFECGQEFEASRHFERSIDAAIRAAQEGGAQCRQAT